MTALLETQGLQKSFGAVVAAKDISVAARRGERLGLIGNNGAGKTTFVNIVTGYLRLRAACAAKASAAPSRSRSCSPA
jgi:branched-chain amino acid transport system ATP-binding protein